MKEQNASKLRELDTAELANKVNESKEQMFRLRFQLSMGQTDGLNKLRMLRKDRARMLGILRERELDPAKAQAAEAAAKARKPARKKTVKPKKEASGKR